MSHSNCLKNLNPRSNPSLDPWSVFGYTILINGPFCEDGCDLTVHIPQSSICRGLRTRDSHNSKKCLCWNVDSGDRRGYSSLHDRRFEDFSAPARGRPITSIPGLPGLAA